ncbi:MAG: aspartyl protease family protein [Thermodesulfobacteriota bacterium]|nr:aspartyl protease family protein [Thermodesulfobacteriota bacterium]
MGYDRVLFVILLAVFLFPLKLHAEFYQYVDKDGELHFVDDKSRIPLEYRQDLKTYNEKYDHLSEEEKKIMLEKDKGKEEQIHKSREAEQRELKRLEQERNKRKAEIAREKYLKSLETKVIINGNQILVPVSVGYGRNKVDALFLLDTGASDIVLHRKIARQLKIKSIKKGASQVAGGKFIKSNPAKLSSLKVGPFNLENVHVIIIDHKGRPVSFDGLLGMSFLRNIKYTVDYKNSIVRWKP